VNVPGVAAKGGQQLLRRHRDLRRRQLARVVDRLAGGGLLPLQQQREVLPEVSEGRPTALLDLGTGREP
jgi:hypothetical protein